MNKRTILPIFGLFAIGGLFALVSHFTLSSVTGLSRVSFSFSHCLAPLMGAFCGLIGAYSVLGSMLSVRLAGSLFGVMRYTYFGLPTFAASLCWATQNRAIRIGIPFGSMVLFLLHPVGYYAAPYTLYWLIPMVIGAMQTRNTILTALASTFTAHAVGSVMHLYIINSMSSVAWLNLIPVVACERLLFAMGMCISYHSVVWLLHAGAIALQNRFADTTPSLK